MPDLLHAPKGAAQTAGESRHGVVARLERDHGLILRATVAFERCVARLGMPGGGEARDREFFSFLLGFFREFADGVHGTQEEEVLMPTLVGAGASVEGGVVREIMDAHLHATQVLARACASRGEAVVKHVSEYSEFARQHLRSEEHSLFPLVERLLDPESEQRVLVGFRQVEARAGAACRFEVFDREIERFLAPVDQLHPGRKRP